MGGYCIDHNLKSNQRGIIDSSCLQVTKKGSNIYRLEDTKYRSFQTHRKILEIKVIKHTTTSSFANKKNVINNGTELCEMLDCMADTGFLPKNLSSSTSSSLSFALSNIIDDEEQNSV